MAKRSSVTNTLEMSKRIRTESNLESSRQCVLFDVISDCPDDWRSACKSKREVWSTARKTGRFCDITLLIGPYLNSVCCYSAHKLFLACASPVFEAMLSSESAVKDKMLQFPEDDPPIFKNLLCYAYGESLNFTTFRSVMETYIMAEKYVMKDLQAQITLCAWDTEFDDSDFWEVLKDLFRCKSFKIVFLNYLAKHADRLLKYKSFYQVPKAVVKIIMQLEHIAIQELDLLRSVTSWCYANITDEKERKSILRSWFTFIRFQDINPREFCEFLDEFPDAVDGASCLPVLKFYICRENVPLQGTPSSRRRRGPFVTLTFPDDFEESDTDD